MEDNKKEIIAGLAWHTYHSSLLTYCRDFDNRVRIIRATKPPIEHKTRLRLFKMVKGRLPRNLTKAAKRYTKATERYDETIRLGSFSDVEEAEGAKMKALLSLNKNIEKYQAKIKALHSQECPDCPFDGETILFSE